jgi:predicted component of type VI protein secretion system
VSRKLVVSDGKRDRELQLVGRLVVGRDPACDISHDHALLSRRHAEFVASGDSVIVRDLGSRNGVFVNGARIAEQPLAAGDVVQIGPLRARYVVDGTAPVIAPEDMDADRTVVIRDLSPAPSARPASPARAPEPVPENDDEVTRLVRAPRTPTPAARPRPPVPPVVADHGRDDDDDRTGFIRAPAVAAEIAASAPAGKAAIPAAAVPQPEPSMVPGPSIGTAPDSAATEELPRPAAMPSLAPFVFGQVALLAAVVLAAVAASSFWRAAPAAGLAASMAVPAGVAAIAVYVVGAAINRRVSGTLAMVQRNRIRG